MRGKLGRGLLIMASQAWVLGAGTPTPQVADYLRACLVQTVVERDGQTFTAGGLCDDPTDCIPPGGDRKIAEIVLAALQADQADHRNEYSVRIHLAQGAIFEGKEGFVDGRFQTAAAQRALWARFLDDPRWTARILERLSKAFDHSGIRIAVPAVSPGATSTTAAEVERIRKILTAALDSPGTGCAANPLIAIHHLAGAGDPVVVAAVYEFLVADRSAGLASVSAHVREMGIAVTP